MKDVVDTIGQETNSAPMRGSVKVRAAKVAMMRDRLREKMQFKKDGTPRMKKCVKCRNKSPIAAFPPHPSSEDGYASYCRDCKNNLAKERRLKDPVARLKHYIVTRIKNELPRENIPKDLQTNIEHYLGYKMRTLVQKLRQDLKEREKKTLFTCFKEGYHLDHIRPHSSFKITRVESQAFKDCWHHTNLRMISATENLKKGAKYDGPT